MTKKNGIAVLCAIAALILGGAAAHADPASDARKAIQAQYDASNAAAAKKNLKAYIAIYAPQFTRVDPKGKISDYKRIRQQMALKFSQTASVSGSTNVASVKLTGATATVHTTDHHVFAYSSPQSGSVQKLSLDVIADDTWTFSNGAWLLTGSKATSEKWFVDGKPAPAP